MSGYRGYQYGVDSPHRVSIRSSSSFPGANGSVSSFHDNLQPSPRGTVPQTNSRGEFQLIKLVRVGTEKPSDLGQIDQISVQLTVKTMSDGE